MENNIEDIAELEEQDKLVINDKKTKKHKNRFEMILREWIIPFGIEIVILLLILKFVCFFVVVPTGSMIPTIDERSVLFAVRVHDLDKLQRGDIVVFNSDELENILIKRLVGLPGEHVELVEGKLYVNDIEINESYVKRPKVDNMSFDVPDGCYLFLGDNRANSRDARYWDNPYIDASDIQGKAIFTLWPFENFGNLR